MREEQILREILHRLGRIEDKIEFHANPANHLEVAEKAEIMRKALATKDRAKIRAASKIINGGR